MSDGGLLILQVKQLELRRLSTELEKMEIDSAKLNAAKEAELSKLRDDIKMKVLQSLSHKHYFACASPAYDPLS